MNQNEQSQAEVRQETSHEEIARRAEELWRQYGSPEGRDEEIWLEAERQLRGTQLMAENRKQGGDLPSSGTFGGPQSSSATEGAQIRSAPKSQEAELMKQPATTTAARSKRKS